MSGFEKWCHHICDNEACGQPHNLCGHEFFDPEGCSGCFADEVIAEMSKPQTSETCKAVPPHPVSALVEHPPHPGHLESCLRDTGIEEAPIENLCKGTHCSACAEIAAAFAEEQRIDDEAMDLANKERDEAVLQERENLWRGEASWHLLGHPDPPPEGCEGRPRTKEKCNICIGIKKEIALAVAKVEAELVASRNETLALAERAVRAEAKNKEWEQSFDLFHKALTVLTEFWQKENGRTNVLPDISGMMDWFMGRLTKVKAERDTLRTALVLVVDSLRFANAAGFDSMKARNAIESAEAGLAKEGQ